MLSATFTRSQRKAIETLDRNVCVSAGAGSGKTKVLVERFIRIVVGSKCGRLAEELRATPEQILVITFTDKATREMKNRIIEAFRQRNLIEELHQIENAYISTIHGFCARLLLENPFEAQIDPQFQALDEVRAAQLLRRCCEIELDRLVEKNDRWIQELLIAIQNKQHELQSGYDASGLLAEAVEQVLMTLRNAGWQREDVEALAAEALDGIARRNLVAVRGFFEPLVAEILACREALMPLLGNLRSEMRAIVSKLDNQITACPLNSGDPNLLLGWFEKIKPLVNRRIVYASGPSEHDLLPLLYRIKEAVAQALKVHKTSRELEEQAIRFCHSFVVLLLQVWRAYEKSKRQLGCLDMEDLQSKAIQLLENFPAVRHRYQKHFRHLLVDEFQDTNLLQVRLVELLHKEDGQICNRKFLVGDIQQSIYGFRGAEPLLFREAVRDAENKREAIHVRLADNFRSRPEVLRLVDQVFRQRAFALESFEPLTPGADFLPKEAPSIEILLAKNMRRDAYLLREAEALAFRIREIVEKGQLRITARSDPRCGEPIRWRDIAVLFRSLTKIALYEEAFASQGVPCFVVGGGRGYYARQEVRDLLNALLYLDTPFDDIALTAVLRSPFVGLRIDSLVELHRLRRERSSEPLHLYLGSLLSSRVLTEREKERLHCFLQIVETLRAQADRLPVGQILERLILHTNYDICLLSRPNGRRRLANMRKLLQMASTEPVFGVSAFIQQLKEIEKLSPREGDAPTEEEEADVVRMLTIHRAKGLEFPLVCLADLSHPFQLPSQELFICHGKTMAIGSRIMGKPDLAYSVIEAMRLKRDQEEAMRLLYVALTRAKEHLLLSGCLNDLSSSSESWASLLFPLLGVNDAPQEPQIRSLVGGLRARVMAIAHSGVSSDANEAYLREKRIDDLAEVLANLTKAMEGATDFKGWSE
ncbi:ATP-dependent exonuclase V beta subunit, helicase and exonuclease domain-containing [Chthonomonas calidirosea]|uniref:DNA 3'-5' helicase n=1 Tax=Chthonomonas calidirosea (strain DSM 23976 / ICMP 18418 / T49) TaxID=1303518 RepID=S0EVC5_CHTCT|nr:UvrD-helicase domain-containing protein [Chthonomonas calidirosea]CCW35708.1 DNA helicase/exodeoxyribonuclease V, subunit A [Chthonomonas calidirosea T49]CEK19475.1 ATP-dependent exonuclase V beta subunit, helicase and exonuclease domain-containing [Chthonomonas calidirosea]